MLPKTLALVEDDLEFRDGLARYLTQLGIDVEAFADSNDLLAHEGAFDFAFYVTDLMLPGVQGIELIKVLRRRSNAGVVVVSGRLSPETFKETITAGADMYLSKPVQFDQIALVIEAVQRRVATTGSNQNAWRLDRNAGQLVAPDSDFVDASNGQRPSRCLCRPGQGLAMPSAQRSPQSEVRQRLRTNSPTRIN